MRELSRRLSVPPYADLGEDQHLKPLFPRGVEPTLADWERERRAIREQWDRVIGTPSYPEFDRAPEVVDTFEQPQCHVTILRLPTGPDTRQLLLLLEPHDPPRTPRPAAIVPFYHPDLMAGLDLKARQPIAERSLVQFGAHLVRQGYVVVCGEAFPYNTVPEPEKNVGFAWWHAGTEKVLRDNPHWTGIGKLVWDTRLATDFLLSRPDVDRERVVIIGHSLGGKMAFYTGCLDERIGAIIASDFGIGWAFTNWDAPWYLGPQIHDPDFPLAHHQLLALHAPRSFFLIAGHADRPASWQYLNAAREAYRLYGREDALAIFDHASGHQPTEESIVAAYQWLAEQFDLPEPDPERYLRA
ncbi:MAG: acetylxylan esterase [Armatimonadetes bacterium]|nr:acetylxylan esterase [Armatimonadota bacterium]